MYGQLVPCGGGQPIALSKTRLVLRPRSQSQPHPTAADGCAELSLKDGYWQIQTSASGPIVRINDVVRETGRLMPSDVLSIGHKRFRISYPLPQTAESPPPAPLPPRRVEPPRPPETALLGLLIPCGGGKSVALRKPRVLVGRTPPCDVVIAHRVVSSRHCELNLIQGHWQMVDLGSHNGTFVDGMRYQTKWVFPGNILGFAQYRYQLAYTAQGERPATRDDDVAVLPRRSLLASVGLNAERLQSLAVPKDQEEPERKRWRIDD
jgi:hypothetical protein